MPTGNTSPILPPEWLHQGGVIHCTTTCTHGKVYMLVHVFSCLIFQHSHTTIVATRWEYRACVTSRHSGLQRTSFSHNLTAL